MEIMSNKAPKSHKELMTTLGFDPRAETVERFVEICERVELKEANEKEKAVRFRQDSEAEDSSDEDGGYQKKKKASKKPRQSYARAPHYCKEHGPNSTHDSVDCKTIKGRKGEMPKKTWASKNKDYKEKYKSKHRELNMLQADLKKSKKAYRLLKSKEGGRAKKAESSDDDNESKSSSEARTFVPREDTRARQKSSSENDSATASEDNSE